MIPQYPGLTQDPVTHNYTRLDVGVLRKGMLARLLLKSALFPRPATSVGRGGNYGTCKQLDTEEKSGNFGRDVNMFSRMCIYLLEVFIRGSLF